MDPGLSPDLIAAIVTLGGIAGTGTLAYVFVRKARAARRRQIEAAEPRSVAKPVSRAKLLLDEEAEPEEPEDQPAGEKPVSAGAPATAAHAPAPARPAPGDGAAAAREEVRERPPAQVLPFPSPAAPA